MIAAGSDAVVRQVKEHQAYIAVAGNTSGSTPKELFEDVAEELEKHVICHFTHAAICCNFSGYLPKTTVGVTGLITR